MTKEHGFFVLFLFLPLIGLFLLGTLPALAETPVAPPETIILISLDTTRADHLSCYGYEQETTPNIDALAKDSLFFEHPFAPAPMSARGARITG